MKLTTFDEVAEDDILVAEVEEEQDDSEDSSFLVAPLLCSFFFLQATAPQHCACKCGGRDSSCRPHPPYAR